MTDIFIVNESERDGYEALLPEELQGLSLFMVAAADDKKVCGILALQARGNGVYDIEYICVCEEERNKGLGSSMILYASEILKTIGAEVFFVRYMQDETTAALDRCFEKARFEKRGASPMKGARLKDFEAGVAGYELKNNDFKVERLCDLSDDRWEDFSDMLRELEEIDESDNIYPRLGKKDEYAGKASILLYDDEDVIKGALLFSEIVDKLSVDYIWTKRFAVKPLSVLLKNALRLAEEVYGEDKFLMCNTCNSLSNALCDKLLGSTDHTIGEAVTMSVRL